MADGDGSYAAPGSDVVVHPVDPGTGEAPVTLLFSEVTQSGETTVTSSNQGPPAPSAFKLGTPPIYYDVETTATFNGSVSLCFGWTEGQYRNENTIRLFHYENGAWQDITTSRDAVANSACGQTSSLSPFTILESAFEFSGFFPPVDNPPTYNRVKAGSAVTWPPKTVPREMLESL